MTIARATVPDKILANVRSICTALPAVIEQTAWAGTRWCVRKKNFAHVLRVDEGWPPAYAKAAGCRGPVCVLTFRSGLAEFDPGVFSERPYFKPPWWSDIAGAILDDQTDWAQIAELIRDSYCRLAPKRLVRLVDGAGKALSSSSSPYGRDAT